MEEQISRLGVTDRQAEVLSLIARGRTNAEISAELQISVSTVKRHLENLFERLGVRSRGALTALLIEDRTEGSRPD